VKRFEFSLARVRDFRRRQLEVEEAKLEVLRVERQQLEVESLRLKNEVAGTRNSLMVTGSVEAQELVAADNYLHCLATEGKRQAAKLADWRERTARQRQTMLEAKRRVRLLEKLEEKQFRSWKEEADRQQESLAAELYLARWGKRKPQNQ
jgi:flagellar export protein FliJ